MNFSNLMQLEWMKIKSYRTFWVLFALFIVSMFGISYIWWYFGREVSKADPALAMVGGSLFGSFSFPGVFNTISYISSWLLYFPGFIIIFHTCNEFIFKTHRQNIIDGLERRQFIMAKLGFAFLLAFICTLVVFISACIFGLITGDGFFTIEGLAWIGLFFIQSLIYILFALFLALLFRKAALAVGIYFIYGILFDFMLAGWISRVFGHGAGFYIMPLQVADQLISNPLMEKGMNAMMGEFNKNIAIAVCLLYIGFFTWFPLWKFRKEDL